MLATLAAAWCLQSHMALAGRSSLDQTACTVAAPVAACVRGSKENNHEELHAYWRRRTFPVVRCACDGGQQWPSIGGRVSQALWPGDASNDGDGFRPL